MKKIIAISLAVLLMLSATVVWAARKTITISIDGKARHIVTYKSTVGDILKKNNIPIYPKDKVHPALTAKVSKKGAITIKRAVKVQITADGKTRAVQSAESSVGAMLKAEGIALNPKDKVKPGLESKLSAGMKVDVIRVEIKTVTESIAIDFNTVLKRNSSLANTYRKTVQEGRKGEQQITALVTYENGKEVARKVTDTVVVKEPVDRIIAQGTYPKMPISRGGDILPFRKVINFKTTAYYAIRGVGRTYTASGRKAVRNPEGFSTVAVDPRVIPIGAKIFIEGYGFAVAADTGSSIKGKIIDVYFNTYKEACRWGVKYVKVYILS